LSVLKTWMAGTSPAMTHKNAGLRRESVQVTLRKFASPHWGEAGEQ
jgi:phenylpyruvate tautomerase PptA (4-oxalocrotonate tautomerase family)